MTAEEEDMILDADTPEKRKELIRKWYNEGRGYAEIGRLFGVSRQRIHQIVTDYQSPYMKNRVRDYIPDSIFKYKFID